LHYVAEYAKSEQELRHQYLERIRMSKDKIEEIQTKKFVVQVHSSFFRSIALCSNTGPLAECYAPTGPHAEKPMENALKISSKFVSIYEQRTPSQAGTVAIGEMLGEEVENAEIIYTDQGVFFYRAYSRGHAYNTSEIWAAFIKSLLSSGYAPSVILSPGFPSSRCFDYVAKHIEPEIYATLLNFRDDFFSREGISSYYDTRPQKIQIGDIVITPEKASCLPVPLAVVISGSEDGGFMRNSNAPVLLKTPELEEIKPAASKAAQERKKDFCGLLISESMTRATESEAFRPYQTTMQAWARFYSQFITQYMENGELKKSILEDGFDLKVFNARNSKAQKRKKGKGKKPGAPGEASTELKESDKSNIIAILTECFAGTMRGFYALTPSELLELFQHNRLHFYDLRLHLQKIQRQMAKDKTEFTALLPQVSATQVKASLSCMRSILSARCGMSSITTYSLSIQDQLLRWSFWNEDKVWRYRGERTENTVQDFLRFVHPNSLPAYPGLAVTLFEDPCPHPTPQGIESQLETLAACEERVVAYLVGEFVDEETYEIVTAWTDNRFGSLGLAISVSHQVKA
jgi:hypothetical protein